MKRLWHEMFVVKSDRTHYPCWLCQGQAIFSKFRENKSFIVSARNKAKNKKKLLLCFFLHHVLTQCEQNVLGQVNATIQPEKVSSDVLKQCRHQEYVYVCFAATIVSNNFDIKNIYIFVLRHQSEAATAARQNYSRIALRWLVGREPVSCGVFYALQGQVSTRP